MLVDFVISSPLLGCSAGALKKESASNNPLPGLYSALKTIM